MTSMAPLEVRNLVKNYGALSAVKSVNLSVQRGEIFGLLGPNGAGKTSIINVITTLEKATEGDVFVFGDSVTKSPNKTKKSIGIVHQEVINSGFFSIYEILEFQSGFYGKRNNHERIEYILKKLSLWQHQEKKVKQLSGGMKRRLMIAKALVHDPKILLLDEPTAGVDFELRETLWSFVRELREQGMAILLTTHYLEEAEELCDRVGIINLGKLEFIGPTKEVIKKFTQRKVVLVLNQEVTIRSPYLLSNQGAHYSFRVPAEKSIGELLEEIQVNASQLKDVQIEEGDLEDAFRSVLRGGESTP